MNWQFLSNAKVRWLRLWRERVQKAKARGEKDWPVLPFAFYLLPSLVVAAGCWLSSWEPLEQVAYRALYKFRGAKAWDERVVVVAIDDASIKAFGLFPWSRRHYTQLLNKLSEAESSVVVLDVLLPERSAEDEAFAEAIAHQGHVVLAKAWDYTGAPLFPHSQLQEFAIAQGHVRNHKDGDGVTRWIEPQFQGIPALSLAAVQAYSLVKAPVKLPNLNQLLWINWPGPVSQAPQYSFVEVILGKVPAQTFKDKIVVVGVTATGLDSLQTPFDNNPPASGVHLHAAVIDNLLQENFLQRPDSSRWVTILLFAAPMLSFTLSRRRMKQQLATVAGLICCWGVVSVLAFQTGYWLPVALPLGLLTFTGAALVLQERLRMTALLQQSEERYRLAVKGSNEGLWDWNLKTNQIYFSPRWKALVGCQDNEIDSSPLDWFNRVHPDDLEQLRAALDAHLNARTPHFESEHRMLHKDGTYRWMLSRGVAVRDAEGNACRMAGSQTGVHERKQAEEQLRHQAFHDALTGLPNRALLIQRLGRALQKANQRQDYLVAVLFLDLDRFKVVNDSLGHTVGDELLVAIAHRLQSCFAAKYTVARLGGDEFTVLLENVRDLSEVTGVAEQIHAVLASPFDLKGHEIFTTASIGIVLSRHEEQSSPEAERGTNPNTSLIHSAHPLVLTSDYERPEDLLRDADMAMYQAKSLSQTPYAVFNKTMHDRARALLQLETDLRYAIEREEFEVYYQPIVSLSTGRIAGFEALIRWDHPQRGWVSPAEFIPVTEDTGLIVPIGRLVLREACRQLRVWQAQCSFPLEIALNVNLSSIQLAQRGLVQEIERILQENQLGGCRLKLEITESSLLENSVFATTLLNQLKALGIQLAIDDFGTGYSSLGRLHRLPIDTLKIDRSFISQSVDESETWEMVRTIVTLAHNLGMDVVTEGVETEEQMMQLQQLQCDYGQGYFFSKPVDAKTALELMLTSVQF